MDPRTRDVLRQLHDHDRAALADQGSDELAVRGRCDGRGGTRAADRLRAVRRRTGRRRRPPQGHPADRGVPRRARRRPAGERPAAASAALAALRGGGGCVGALRSATARDQLTARPDRPARPAHRRLRAQLHARAARAGRGPGTRRRGGRHRRNTHRLRDHGHRIHRVGHPVPTAGPRAPHRQGGEAVAAQCGGGGALRLEQAGAARHLRGRPDRDVLRLPGRAVPLPRRSSWTPSGPSGCCTGRFRSVPSWSI